MAPLPACTPNPLLCSLTIVLCRYPSHVSQSYAMLANVSTMVGLLGTIFGLITAFESVAAADPAEKSIMLANGISMAMSTTAFGLISAIPLLIAHSFLPPRPTL